MVSPKEDTGWLSWESRYVWIDSVCGSVGAMNAELSRPDLLATVQSGRKQA